MGDRFYNLREGGNNKFFEIYFERKARPYLIGFLIITFLAAFLFRLEVNIFTLYFEYGSFSYFTSFIGLAVFGYLVMLWFTHRKMIIFYNSDNKQFLLDSQYGFFRRIKRVFLEKDVKFIAKKQFNLLDRGYGLYLNSVKFNENILISGKNMSMMHAENIMENSFCFSREELLEVSAFLKIKLVFRD